MDHNITFTTTLFPEGWNDYELIDSGNAQKLERFGHFRFIRPETQALWTPHLATSVWAEASGSFVSAAEDKGKWSLNNDVPASWPLQFEDVHFLAMPTPFRHLGFFPEQSPHWKWTAIQIKKFIATHQKPPRILNLFAYSGVASLHAARAGAEVTHVDASKKAIAQAFLNRKLSDLEDAPIRFITDDALRFVEREARRGHFYDGILLDPPKYGRGPKGEIWQLTEDLPALLTACRNILSPTPLLLIATIYAIRLSTIAAHSAIASALEGLGGRLQSGELAIAESRPDGRMIGQALYVRWNVADDERSIS